MRTGEEFRQQLSAALVSNLSNGTHPWRVVRIKDLLLGSNFSKSKALAAALQLSEDAEHFVACEFRSILVLSALSSERTHFEGSTR